MKKLFYLIPALFLAGILFYACQEPNVSEPDSSSINKDVDGYEIVLIGGEPVDNGDGTYTWTWSITQTTALRALSHWNFLPGLCLIEDDIESAAYRYGPDGDFTSIVLEEPYFKPDPSMDCEDGNDVFKFEYGTENGGVDVTTYYQLVVNKNFEVDPNAIAYWKASTFCGQGTFDGIGCDEPCSQYGVTFADFSGMPPIGTPISGGATALVDVDLCDGKTVAIQATNISSEKFKFNGGPLAADFWQTDHSQFGDLNLTGTTSRMNTRCLDANGSPNGEMPNSYTLTWDFIPSSLVSSGARKMSSP
jgi:hypothetical protein